MALGFEHDGNFRAGSLGEALAMLTPITDFPGFIASLTADQGYSLNQCRDCCPDKGGAEHAHLRTPDKDDMIVWADGNWIMHDLTQPAHLIYPVYAVPKRRR